MTYQCDFRFPSGLSVQNVDKGLDILLELIRKIVITAIPTGLYLYCGAFHFQNPVWRQGFAIQNDLLQIDS